MAIKYSVLIPSHNRAEQLLLTLTAFENQTISKEHFEVIVIDDGSTDQTKEAVNNYHPEYNFFYKAFYTRRGVSAAFNEGINLAKGKIIIFCDADFLVFPEFVETHQIYQQKFENSIISGFPTNIWEVCTLYYPEFENWQKKRIDEVLRKQNLWQERYNNLPEIAEIVTQEDVRTNFSKIRSLIWRYNGLNAEKIQEFKKTDVAPWWLFITRCLSINKRFLVGTNGFDEEFIRGADWELGYRIHQKYNLPYACINEVVGYHQEHPQKFRNKTTISGKPWHQILFQKHGKSDPELALLSIWSNQDIVAYKNTLRGLKTLSQSTEQSYLAKSLIKALQKF